MVKRPMPKIKLSRREIFIRDNFMCLYCGKVPVDLTIDHVVPRYRGGAYSRDNLVTACVPCNHRKSGRTPREAGMI
jgi:5-methylcytosine-specific restriction endonuclease McrA